MNAGVACHVTGSSGCDGATDSSSGAMITPIHGVSQLTHDQVGESPPLVPSSYPKKWCCIITDTPPLHAVTFDIRDDIGNLSEQVFNYSELYCHIANTEYLTPYRKI